MCCSVIICHCPGSRKKSKQEREARRRPACSGLDTRPNILRSMFVVTHDQQDDTTTDEHTQMKDYICSRQLLQKLCIEAVEYRMEYQHGSRHPNRLVFRRYVRKVGAHRHSRQQQLRTTIFRRRQPSNLSNHRQPAAQPTNLRHPSRRCKVFASEVESSGRGIGGNELGDG